MGRRSSPGDPEAIRTRLADLLDNFRRELRGKDLRNKVRALIPAYHHLRDLGSSLVQEPDVNSGRSRMLSYLLKYPRTVIEGEELMVVAGIDDWARRVRELRVEFGWAIATGVTLREMIEEHELSEDDLDLSSLKIEDYVLLAEEHDRDASHRWHLANEIRRAPGAVRDKILAYLRQNVHRAVTGEELRYIAKDRKEWARRTRELRTEHGWPVATKNSGRPDLGVGVYILEEDRQLPAHDRAIPDPVRVTVLVRDEFSCQDCAWSREKARRGDPRHLLELHHIKHHVSGGANTAANLITLCNVCHDKRHKAERLS